jgi:hypothetical protein
MIESTRFGGTTPQNYHEGLGPMFFEPYARDLAARLTLPPGARVLEIAAGCAAPMRLPMRARVFTASN